MPPIEDGTTELPITVEEGSEMTNPIDLPPNVASHIAKTGSESYQALMTDIQHNGANVHNLARLEGVRQARELDTLESRANSGVMATPIASPTTQSGS